MWDSALEGFKVRESTLVNEWKAEGKAEALREILETRFGTLPAEVAAKVGETREAETLKRWLVFAARAATLEQFRQEAGI